MKNNKYKKFVVFPYLKNILYKYTSQVAYHCSLAFKLKPEWKIPIAQSLSHNKS